MFSKPRDWAPINDTWLSILVAFIISLLVNAVYGFILDALSVLQIIFLLIACVLIGFYTDRKGTAREEYEKKIEEEKLYGPENAIKRENGRRTINTNLKRTARPIFYAFIGCLLIAVVLLVIQAYQKREVSRNEMQSAKWMRTDIKYIKEWIEKHQLESPTVRQFRRGDEVDAIRTGNDGFDKTEKKPLNASGKEAQKNDNLSNKSEFKYQKGIENLPEKKDIMR